MVQNPSGTAGRFLQKLLFSMWLRLCTQRLDVSGMMGLPWLGPLHAGVMQVIDNILLLLSFYSSAPTGCNNNPDSLIRAPHNLLH